MKTQIKAAFDVLNTNGKGVTKIGLIIKGKLSREQYATLHELKETGVVFADLFDGQADMEDYAHDDVTSEGPHKGVGYSVDQDGTAQVTMDDLEITEANDDDVTPEEEAFMEAEIQAAEEAHEKEVMPDDLPF